MTRKVFPFSSLDTGSTNRLTAYQDRLRRDKQSRNFDLDVLKLIREYARPEHIKMIVREETYLRYLKSSENGLLYCQGVKEYSKLEVAASRFAEPNHPYGGHLMNYKSAKEKILREVRGLNLHPLLLDSDDAIEMALPKKDTHAGFLAIQEGPREKGAYIEGSAEMLKNAEAIVMAEGYMNYPMMAAVRTQVSGEFDGHGRETGDCKHKTRLVLMVDMRQILMELHFSAPFQEYMSKVNWYAGGKNLDVDLSTRITALRRDFPYWMSLDYSGFDASVSAWLIHDAFEIIRAAFDDLTPEMEKLFRAVENAFIEKDIILSDRVVHSVKGVASGSMFTQIVDSIVNRLVIETYLNAKGIKGDMVIMGDDNLVFTVEPVDEADLAGYVLRNFGMTIHPAKTEKGESQWDYPVFLSCRWTPNGRDREVHQVIAKMLYPERKRRYGGQFGTPELTLWSYCLAYPATMRRLICIERFIEQHPNFRRLALGDVASQHLPGFLRYLRDYAGGSWSRPGVAA